MANWKYDSDVNALYVYALSTSPKNQIVVQSNVILDVDENGNICGVEILCPDIPQDLVAQ